MLSVVFWMSAQCTIQLLSLLMMLSQSSPSRSVTCSIAMGE
jgi:hypothetical protein